MENKIGDIVFFLDELSLHTAIIVGKVVENEEEELGKIYVKENHTTVTSFIVREPTTDNTAPKWSRRVIHVSQIMRIDEAISELQRRIAGITKF